TFVTSRSSSATRRRPPRSTTRSSPARSRTWWGCLDGANERSRPWQRRAGGATRPGPGGHEPVVASGDPAAHGGATAIVTAGGEWLAARAAGRPPGRRRRGSPAGHVGNADARERGARREGAGRPAASPRTGPRGGPGRRA